MHAVAAKAKMDAAKMALAQGEVLLSHLKRAPSKAGPPKRPRKGPGAEPGIAS